MLPIKKIHRKIAFYLRRLHGLMRICYYKLLSDPILIGYRPIQYQPVLFCGLGTISIGENVTLGYSPSPMLYNSYSHIEARGLDSKISIGDNTYINNNAIIIAEKTSIDIGQRCTIGPNLIIFDSDFHGINPSARHIYTSKPVTIGDNVFIGANVIFTKGVSIGDNCTIAAGSIVTRSFPKNTLIGGNPAKIIKNLIE